MTEARSEILARIRRATSGSETRSWEEISREYRGYRSSSTASAGDLIALLAHRLRDYDAQVVESPESNVPATIARLLKARKVSRMIVPQGVPGSFLPDDFDFIQDSGLSYAELDDAGGVLTECTLAIAETGTIVLQNVPGQGRRAATLIPDYHLCIVNTSRIVATVPEAMERLHATADLPTTFISGPSATADIEMTRIKGVHGPRFLDVVLVQT